MCLKKKIVFEDVQPVGTLRRVLSDSKPMRFLFLANTRPNARLKLGMKPIRSMFSYSSEGPSVCVLPVDSFDQSGWVRNRTSLPAFGAHPLRPLGTDARSPNSPVTWQLGRACQGQTESAVAVTLGALCNRDNEPFPLFRLPVHHLLSILSFAGSAKAVDTGDARHAVWCMTLDEVLPFGNLMRTALSWKRCQSLQWGMRAERPRAERPRGGCHR